MNDPVFRNVRFLPGTIHAGFPSPVSDYEEQEFDINDLVMPHPTTSYFMRVEGDSMMWNIRTVSKKLFNKKALLVHIINLQRRMRDWYFRTLATTLFLR
jgi:hypothetical protein